MAAAPRPVLPGHQDRRARVPRRAREEIRRSLERLRVDQVDLIQLHNLVDPDRVGEGAAGRAARWRRRSRRATRAWCASSASPATASTVADDAPAQPASASPSTPCCCPTTTSMMQNAQLRAPTSRRSLAICAERGVAVQTIKAITRAPWGERTADRRHLVRAAARAGRHRPRRALGARPAGASSSTPSAT